MEVLTSAEREVAKEVAEHAMIAGWETAVKKKATELRVHIRDVIKILDRAEDYNSKADPSGRIHELNDWALEKKSTSERARARP